MRLALVANGSFDDPMVVSGVPFNFGQALRRRDDVDVVATVSAFPPRPVRWLARAVTFHPERGRWDQRYVHGGALTALRSWIRDVQLSRLDDPPTMVVHVRSWFRPSRLPYAVFIDATGAMLDGVSDKWSSSGSTAKAKRRLEARYYGGAQVVFCASRAAAASLEQQYGVDPGAITVVGGGTNLAPVSPPRLRRGPATRLLFVGKEVERKGLPELLTAFSRARSVEPDLTLTVAGIAPGLPVPSGVTMLGLVQDRAALSRLYERADVFCLPSRQESFGLVVPEAMAHGLPCIVTRTGELHEMVQDGVSGLVVDVNAPEQLTQAILALAAPSADLEPMSAAALRRSADYTWDAVASRVVERLREPR
jgi:glycosyltransferase involved in cell wall biosynthesis